MVVPHLRSLRLDLVGTEQSVGTLRSSFSFDSSIRHHATSKEAFHRLTSQEEDQRANKQPLRQRLVSSVIYAGLRLNEACARSSELESEGTCMERAWRMLCPASSSGLLRCCDHFTLLRFVCPWIESIAIFLALYTDEEGIGRQSPFGLQLRLISWFVVGFAACL